MLAARCCAFLALLIGVTVAIGWCAHLSYLIQLKESYTPMQFNTALCFILSSISLLAVLFESKKISLLFILPLFIVCGLTLFDYLMGTNSGIDTFFMNPFLITDKSQPGRMASITAIGFISVMLMILSLNIKNTSVGFFCSILSASLVFLIGVVTSIGYIFNIEMAYSLGQITQVSLQTSVCFILLSCSTLAYIWHKEKNKSEHLIAIWLSSLAALITLSLTIALWQQSLKNENTLIQDKLKLEANILVNRINDHLIGSVIALRRMSSRWASRIATPRNEWAMDAQNYLHDTNGLLSIEWIDSNYQMRWFESLNLDYNKAQFLEVYNKKWKHFLKKRPYNKSILLTPPIEMNTNERLIIAFVPIYNKMSFQGYFAGVYDIKNLVSNIFFSDNNQLFGIKIQDEGHEVYTSFASKIVPGNSASIRFPVFNRTWEIKVESTEEFLKQEISLVPSLGLAGGAILALLLGISIYYGAIAIQRNKQLKEKSIALKTSEETFRSAMQYAAIGMALVSLEGKWLKVNQSLCQIVGYTEEELLNLTFQTITHPDDLELDLSYVKKLLSGEIKTYQMEKRYIHKNGSIVWVLLSGSLLRNSDGTPLYFIAQIQSIDAQKKIEEELKHNAYHDVLTGLANRKQLELSYELALAFAKRQNTLIAILFLDLDGFKTINDNCGHEIGDELLIEVARRLQSAVRTTDILVRLGGDEFILVLTELTSQAQAIEKSKQIVELISTPIVIKQQQFSISASIGVSIYPKDGESLQTLLKYADEALYRVKSEGKNNFKLYSHKE